MHNSNFQGQVMPLSTHNTCFLRELRKNYQYFSLAVVSYLTKALLKVKKIKPTLWHDLFDLEYYSPVNPDKIMMSW